MGPGRPIESSAGSLGIIWGPEDETILSEFKDLRRLGIDMTEDVSAWNPFPSYVILE